MKNEYGVDLDQNGYAPSIMNRQQGCYVCLRQLTTERHEIFHGTANRTKSKNFGLWVDLCHACHTIVHNGDGSLDRMLKEDGQHEAMDYYNWTVADFRKRFGKNYL